MPSNRRWEPDCGTQERCLGCIQGRRTCSAPERVKATYPGKIQRALGTGNMASVGQDPVEPCARDEEHNEMSKLYSPYVPFDFQECS
jgi:hypothetical protein